MNTKAVQIPASVGHFFYYLQFNSKSIGDKY